MTTLAACISTCRATTAAAWTASGFPMRGSAMQARLLSWDFAAPCRQPFIGPDRADLCLPAAQSSRRSAAAGRQPHAASADRGSRRAADRYDGGDGAWRRGRPRRHQRSFGSRRRRGTGKAPRRNRRMTKSPIGAIAAAASSDRRSRRAS
ncbi:hypothetical protein F2981_09715 [Sinorhizobium meliloti]|nr:hypothetical protein [Sinorhizobium meliloti]